jgi:hypothetical protein
VVPIAKCLFKGGIQIMNGNVEEESRHNFAHSHITPVEIEEEVHV